MAGDISLTEAARALLATAEDGRPVSPLLKKLCPHIHRQIVADGKRPGLLSLWGRSANFDEHAGQTILHPAIVRAIGQLAGVPMRGRFVHAGLLHTYGYLFSLIDTPYGAKRDRWVSEEWERGFGLERSLLGPNPKAGTLLANLTWFLGHIVFQGRPRLLHVLNADVAAVAPQIIRYDFDKLDVRRLREQVIFPHKTGRLACLQTDLVPFPRRPANSEAESTVLIYSIQNSLRAAPRLVTAFPVSTETARDLEASFSRPGPAAIRLRYNAYLPGLYGRTVRGRRCRLP